jgi:poly-beta-1,6-N-acetyl-D-glucosamine synthase
MWRSSHRPSGRSRSHELERRAPVRAARMVALVPAHNEAEHIAATLDALLAQTLPFDGIVVADHCTDAMVQIARRYPVEVIETVGNTHRKSGALNMAWWRCAQDADLVVTVDADTGHCPAGTRIYRVLMSG